MDVITGLLGGLVDFILNPPVSVVRGATQLGMDLFNCTAAALTTFGGVIVDAAKGVF